MSFAAPFQAPVNIAFGAGSIEPPGVFSCAACRPPLSDGLPPSEAASTTVVRRMLTSSTTGWGTMSPDVCHGWICGHPYGEVDYWCSQAMLAFVGLGAAVIGLKQLQTYQQTELLKYIQSEKSGTREGMCLNIWWTGSQPNICQQIESTRAWRRLHMM